MRYTDQYIADTIDCTRNKLAAASYIVYRENYFGTYGGTVPASHVSQLQAYLFVLLKWDNRQGAYNSITENELSQVIEAMMRMPYDCEPLVTSPITQPGATNRPPVVFAGLDQTLVSGSVATTLSGTASDPEGGPVTTLWTKVSGPNATINSPTSLITSVTNLNPGTYVFRLTAIDAQGLSAFDDMILIISSVTDLIFYGRTSDIPILTEAFILAGSSFNSDGSIDVVVPLHVGSSTPDYAWYAIPNITPSHNKNVWAVNSDDRGPIGGANNLFGNPQTIFVNSIQYFFGITNYKTLMAGATQLKKE